MPRLPPSGPLPCALRSLRVCLLRLSRWDFFAVGLVPLAGFFGAMVFLLVPSGSERVSCARSAAGFNASAAPGAALFAITNLCNHLACASVPMNNVIGPTLGPDGGLNRDHRSPIQPP